MASSATVAFILAVAFFGSSSAHFKCLRNISCYENHNEIINIPQILSLESICFDFCRQTNCSSMLPTDLVGKLAGGIAGAVTDVIAAPLKCLLDPNGDGKNPNQVTPFQACAFPCILDLNLLNICDIQAIVTSLVKICPETDARGLCLSACLCCGEENQPIDVCVNLCLSNQGIDLSIKPADLPLLDGILHGQDGEVLHIGGKDSGEQKDEGLLQGIIGDLDILGGGSKGKGDGGCDKCQGGNGGSTQGGNGGEVTNPSGEATTAGGNGGEATTAGGNGGEGTTAGGHGGEDGGEVTTAAPAPETTGAPAQDEPTTPCATPAE